MTTVVSLSDVRPNHTCVMKSIPGEIVKFVANLHACPPHLTTDLVHAI